MTDAPSFAVMQRRQSRLQEFAEQTKFARLMEKHLDRKCTFWTALENKPISRVSGMFQKRRGVRSGLADVYVLYRGKSIFVELKSRRGVASKTQKQVRTELLPAGADWWLARSGRAAMMALHLSGVVFRRRWKPPRLKPWEGPFSGTERSLPQHPLVAAERAAARRRWRERQRRRETPRPEPPHAGAQTARRENEARATR